MNKNDVFKYQPERENERDYFLNSFPSMPDKAGLFVGMNAISYMSDEAFVYYLPFFMECLLEDPYPYDRLSITVEVRLEYMSAESEERYKDQLALARQQMAEVQRKFY